MGSSWTRARTHVPCIGRWILNHCATREALVGKIIRSITHSRDVIKLSLQKNLFAVWKWIVGKRSNCRDIRPNSPRLEVSELSDGGNEEDYMDLRGNRGKSNMCVFAPGLWGRRRTQVYVQLFGLWGWVTSCIRQKDGHWEEEQFWGGAELSFGHVECAIYVGHQGEMLSRKLPILLYKSGQKSGLDRGLDK